MKKIFIVATLLQLFACGPNREEYMAIKRREADSVALSEYGHLIEKPDIVPFDLDGCEYLVYVDHNIIHKQNCKNH